MFVQKIITDWDYPENHPIGYADGWFVYHQEMIDTNIVSSLHRSYASVIRKANVLNEDMFERNPERLLAPLYNTKYLPSKGVFVNTPNFRKFSTFREDGCNQFYNTPGKGFLYRTLWIVTMRLFS